HEQHRRLRQGELGIGIARLDLKRIEQLDPRHRDARLDGRDGGVAGGLDRRERTDATGYGLGDAGELERDLGNDAERAFRADEETREVVTGRALLGAAPGA